MNTRTFGIATLAFLLTLVASYAAPSFKQQIKGLYTGRVTGAINITSGTLQEFRPVNTIANSFIGGGGSVVLSPTNRSVSYRSKSRIRNERAILQFRYHGTFLNPNNGLIESYSGKRKAIIRKTGKRFVMRYTDRLVEGSLSGWLLRGRLTKPSN